MHDAVRPGTLRLVVTITVVALALVATVSPASATTKPVAPPAVALRVIGPADCSATTAAGAEVLLAVTVTGGHTICVVRDDQTIRQFFDGRLGSTSTAGTDSSFTGGVGTIGRRLVVLADLAEPATALKLTFCNGDVAMLKALNTDGPPRFFAAAVAADRYGIPVTEPVLSAGSTMSTKDARQLACRRIPPVTSKTRS